MLLDIYNFPNRFLYIFHPVRACGHLGQYCDTGAGGNWILLHTFPFQKNFNNIRPNFVAFAHMNTLSSLFATWSSLMSGILVLKLRHQMVAKVIRMWQNIVLYQFISNLIVGVKKDQLELHFIHHLPRYLCMIIINSGCFTSGDWLIVHHSKLPASN